ncbi:MAG TPA: PCYCGC motif-containing (lipo)protein [Thermomicrobiales bacterium]|nr:PCYCGC motif-containing (lipo)protein [Thermomicrobiales bacterium]
MRKRSSGPNWRGRAALLLLLGVALLAAGAVALLRGPLAGRATAEDRVAARFAAYAAADEPDGDLARVVWPDFVTAAGPEVQRLYAFQVEHGDLMKYMPCYCGCGRSGHRSNRDCYVRQVNADGSVVFDSMAPT